MLGLPGDFTPPSRFVRATWFTNTVLSPANGQEARDTVFHILDLFNIPKGVVRAGTQAKFESDYTQWTAVCDLSKPTYYWHTYDNRAISCILISAIKGRFTEPKFLDMETTIQW